MSEVLVHYNENQYFVQLEAVEDLGTQVLDPIVKRFNAMKIGDLESAELPKLFTALNDLLLDKVTAGKKLMIGDLQVDRSKAIDMIQKPSGFEELAATIELAKNTITESGTGVQPNHSILSVFELVEGGVIVKKSYSEKLRKENMHYAQTDAAKAALSFAEAVIKAAKEHDILEACVPSRELGDAVRRLIKYNSETKTLHINTQNVLWYNSSRLYKAKQK